MHLSGHSHAADPLTNKASASFGQSLPLTSSSSPTRFWWKGVVCGATMRRIGSCSRLVSFGEHEIKIQVCMFPSDMCLSNPDPPPPPPAQPKLLAAYLPGYHSLRSRPGTILRSLSRATDACTHGAWYTRSGWQRSFARSLSKHFCSESTHGGSTTTTSVPAAEHQWRF
jgi:hypothetical protein